MLFVVLLGVCLIFVARQLLLQRRIVVRRHVRPSFETMISSVARDDHKPTGGVSDDA